MVVKPFLKWVGGKTQIMQDLIKNLPDNISDIDTYVEPFIGGGSVLFNLIPYFNNIHNITIMDINDKLINVYQQIKDNPNELIEQLNELQNTYYNFTDLTNKEIFYYNNRNKFNDINTLKTEKIYHAALFIFLNKTGFNGLYRENSKGLLNVPWNKSNKPTICDKDNILNVHNFLTQYNVNIINASYDTCLKYIKNNSTFVYFDPPYRPITKSSAFTAYTKSGFNDDSQKHLKTICDKINEKHCYFMLSNSDPKNTNIEDSFFDDLYSDYNILRVKARRNINSDGNNRGCINEILVKNY